MNALIADRKLSYDFNDAHADYGNAIQDLLDVLTWGGGVRASMTSLDLMARLRYTQTWFAFLSFDGGGEHTHRDGPDALWLEIHA